MKRTQKLLGLLVLVAGLNVRGDAPAKAPSKAAVQVVSVADLKWEPASGEGIPPGAMVSDVMSAGGKELSARYVKYPPGYTFPSHWHSSTEKDVVLMGKPRYTIDGKTYETAPGSYVTIPAKTHHQVTCASESECLIIYRWSSSADFHFDK